jgi:hypothetical protein
MNGQNDDPADDYECSTLVNHDGSRVWVTDAIRPAYDDFEEAKRERLNRIMKNWCEERALTNTMFNYNEGRTVGGIMLQAFKSFKHRFYGFERQIAGIRTFVVIDYDGAKKQDKGDQRVLRRAKRRIDAFAEGKLK